MKPVVQEEATGCGIASVGAIANVSYERVRARAARLGIAATDPKLWSETGYVRILLADFGIRAAGTKRKFTSWKSLPDVALLAIKWHREKRRPFWHWGVFVRDRNASYVLDPKKALKQNRRTDFGRIKPKWFIEVYRSDAKARSPRA